MKQKHFRITIQIDIFTHQTATAKTAAASAWDTLANSPRLVIDTECNGKKEQVEIDNLNMPSLNP